MSDAGEKGMGEIDFLTVFEAKELMDAPHVSTVLLYYDFIQHVPCQDDTCTGYLVPTGPPILAPGWGGGVKYPFRCSKDHTIGHISRSSIKERGAKLTWGEIKRLKEMLKAWMR